MVEIGEREAVHAAQPTRPAAHRHAAAGRVTTLPAAGHTITRHAAARHPAAHATPPPAAHATPPPAAHATPPPA
ncbi:hypothetical protein Q5424_28970, partial [Conexibacter sp. JD483]